MRCTPEAATLVIDQIYSGKNLTEALGSDARFRRSFYELLEKNPQLAQAYAQAQQCKAEMLADEIINIADDDIDPQRARNRISVRQWYAGKIKSHKYGDNINVNVQGSIDLVAAIAEGERRVSRLRCDNDQIVDAEATEIAGRIGQEATDCEPVMPSETLDLKAAKLSTPASTAPLTADDIFK